MMELFERKDWMQFARCIDKPKDLFYPEKGGDITRATSICDQCPVKLQCLEYALETREEFGVWVGISAKRRQAILRYRRRTTMEMSA